MKKLLLFSLLIGSVGFAQTVDDSNTVLLKIDSELSAKMLDPNQNLRKVQILLEEKQNGNLKNKSLILGASLITIFDYQKSNTDSKFAYLMRHPTSNNQIGTEVSEALVHSFQVSLTGSINSWISSYAELLYNPEQSFGAGTITALARNQIQLRKGFVVFGDLNKFPLFAAIGKMDAPFGQTGSVSPFTNSTLWHAFGGLGYGAQIGYSKANFKATFMAVQGGAQFRALHTPVGDDTNVPSQLNNFTADVNYTLELGEKTRVTLGASYLHGSAYCQEFPVTHFSACSDNNAAYTYYGKVNYDDKLILEGGFAKTLDVWKGTHNPTPPLDVFEASKVSSLDLGAKYNLNKDADIIYAISGEFSNFKAGPEGAPWERQNQYILGFSGLINNSSKLFVEFFRTEGYAPLNWISGSDAFAPFPPGQTHSLNDAMSHGIVVGAQITF